VSSPTCFALPQVASATAAMLGAAMLIERVAPLAKLL
jgi:hypothetical protein